MDRQGPRAVLALAGGTKERAWACGLQEALHWMGRDFGFVILSCQLCHFALSFSSQLFLLRPLSWLILSLVQAMGAEGRKRKKGPKKEQ